MHLCRYMNSGNFMQRIYLLLFCLSGFVSFAQVMQTVEKDTIELDSVPAVADPKYREDQFYASVAYALMQGNPDGYKQYSFSTSLSTGFLRDMPLNKRRNHSIALGFGYTYNNIKHNLAVTEKGGVNSYNVIDKDQYKLNKLVLHYLDVPLEFRWRNSDSISHKFWRVYLGVKASYMFYNKAQLEPEEGGGTVKIRKDPNINKFVYSTYISAGWNTWNFYVSYGTPIYDTAMIDGKRLKMSPVKLGLIFYIL